MNNRLWNVHNPAQSLRKKVLCVCSAGLLRSPTIAYVLSNPPYNFNTRSCGAYDFGLIILDNVLLEWADEIVCASYSHEKIVKNKLIINKKIIVLDLPDIYDFRDPKLEKLIKKKYPHVNKKIS